MTPLVLASGSPRRREILSQMGLSFALKPSDVPEPAFSGGDPAVYAAALAASKAEAVAALPESAGAVVLGADTIVIIDDEVLGKPEDDAHARAMIAQLAGRTHRVITAVALRGACTCDYSACTAVAFRALSEAEVAGYVACGEGRDKAGAYGIQGVGMGLVSRIEGSYSNVVGLPVAETIAALREAGVLERWP